MPHDSSVTEAVEGLFSLYADDVYRYARFVLHDAREAEDVVQEVFIRVMKNWKSFRFQSSPKTWIWKIMQNHIVDVQRRKRRQQLWTMANPIERIAESPGGDAAPVDRLYLEESLAKLPLSYRQVVVLRLIQDLSTAETAEVLHWTETKVRTTLHRAVAQLRNILNDGNLMSSPSGGAHGV